MFGTLTFTLLTVLLFNFGASQLDKCPAGVTKDRYLQVHGDSCFWFVIFRQRTHSQAKADCASFGGTLALVKTQELNDYIYNQLVQTYRSPVGTLWIGLNDINNEDTFVWEDGSSLAYSNFATSEGTANNTQGVHTPHPNEDCVVIDIGARGKWRDYQCDLHTTSIINTAELHSYLCQFKLSA